MATVFGSGAADTIAPSGISGGVTGGRPGSGADVIYGYDGADLLDGGGGANTILGGLGDDTIYSSGLGESLDGGNDTDSYVHAGSDWIVVDLGTGGTGFATKLGVTDTLAGFERAYTGSGNDTLKGTNNNDTLGGGQGKDLIDGRAGFDLIDYGTSYTGAPTMGAIVNLSSASVTVGGTAYAAGTARDGWGTLDTLANIEGAIGTGFADTLIGRTDAASRLEGGAGDDSLVGGNGPNTILGGDGDDTVVFGGYSESLYGGAGNDALVYRGAHALVIDLGTATGADGYQGFISDFSVLTQIFGFERAYGSTGNDTIKGTFGDDTLAGGAGNDLIDGRGGFNTVDYASSTAGIVVNLSSGSQSIGGTTLAAGTARDGLSGTDTLTNIHGIIGTAFADSVVGSNLDNRITGGEAETP